jgi:hypothetical protein
MTREEYNTAHQTNYALQERVPEGAYDSYCCSCYMGHVHTWLEHDRSVQHVRAIMPTIGGDTE